MFNWLSDFAAAPPPAAALVEKLLVIDQLRDLYRRVRVPADRSFPENILRELQVEYRAEPEDLARIPTHGPVVVVANHPFGILDGVLLAAVLPSLRSDVKIVTNQLLAGIPELAQQCLFVNPFGGARATAANRRALRKAIEWLEAGKLLAMFPAGEVSSFRLRHGDVADPEWSEMAARLIRRAGATAVPVYFRGGNSVPFQLLGLIHPRLRTARLPRELMNKVGRRIEMAVGTPIPARVLREIACDRDATSYLRWRTYLLANRVPQTAPTQRQKSGGERPVMPALPADSVAADVAKLRPEQRVEETAEFAVYLIRAGDGPSLMHELGRQRELTFRAVGEGTGTETDLDSFDAYYHHLVLWHKERREVAGAYRIGHTNELLAKRGIEGLYTSTLFAYETEFFQRLGPSLELGRSFIRLEYQRQYAPLLLLWKGLARYVAQRPQTPVLFGAVSMSAEYHPASRGLVAQFFESQAPQHELTKFLRPRRPFKAVAVRDLDAATMHRTLSHEALGAAIADIEPDRKELPILFRQYLKLGGKLLGFNVDHSFSEALDGLIVVDLRETMPAVLERYMGKEGLASFRRHHGLPSRCQPLREPALVM